MSEEYTLSEKPWNIQLQEIIKAYHKGIITYAEYIVRQNQVIGQALMSGVAWEEINNFTA